jgi:hypothetical protein
LKPGLKDIKKGDSGKQDPKSNGGKKEETIAAK